MKLQLAVTGCHGKASLTNLCELMEVRPPDKEVRNHFQAVLQPFILNLQMSVAVFG